MVEIDGRSITWAIMLAASVALVVRGVRFRRGTSRALVALYRRTELPAIYRNLPLVAPVVGSFVAGLLVVATPIFVTLDFDLSVPRWLIGTYFAALGTAFFFSVAVVIWLLSRPRDDMRPRWLREEDERIGFVAPELDWFDKLALLVAVVFAFLGVVTGIITAGILVAGT